MVNYFNKTSDWLINRTDVYVNQTFDEFKSACGGKLPCCLLNSIFLTFIEIYKTLTAATLPTTTREVYVAAVNAITKSEFDRIGATLVRTIVDSTDTCPHPNFHEQRKTSSKPFRIEFLMQHMDGTSFYTNSVVHKP